MPFIQGDDFTHKSQEAMLKAQSIARKYEQQQIDVVHLLLALLEQEESIVLAILNALQVDIDDLKKKIEKVVVQNPFSPPSQSAGQFYLTQDLAQTLERARIEAANMKDDFISVEHLFLGILSAKTEVRKFWRKLNFLIPMFQFL